MSNQTFTTSDGCRIAYTLRGKAGSPRIALVHSLALGGLIWDGVAEVLAARAQVLTYDCRGHNASDKKHGPYTPELFARDLAELMTHVGWKDAAVAGCSMGGCVALAFARDHAARLTGLGLVDTTAWYGADAPKAWRERAATGRAKGLASLSEFQMTRWFGDAYRSGEAKAAKQLLAVFEANDVECYAAACEMLGDSDLRPALAGIRVPTAIVVGSEDFATPVAMSEQLHANIAGSSFKVLQGGRHLTPVEMPREVSDVLATILR